ncbi:MAG: hypothetical protein DWQ07_05540 [Chloroflexi bacterium]|nr:MAG: hypothetical protein DWQ07_05540 [Chloroflexota bacterium]MBL1194894.1 hypothetical protein [Chloroflexota bacterium]NOH12185.1 site-specific integrase [Chloroflexota bacterium]
MTDSIGIAHITSETPLIPAINAWRYFLEDQGRSPHTIKAFIGDLNLLADYLAPDKNLGSVQTNDLNNFLDWLQNGRGVPCSPKTLSRRITSTKSFFRWLQANGAILADPAEKVVSKSVLSPLPDALDANEIQAVLEAADKHRHAPKADARPYALVKLLLDTAIKKSETLGLTTNHVELEGANGPFIFVRYANPQHRYKERKITVSDEWVEAYKEYSNQYDLSEKLFPWSQRRLEYILEDIGKEAALENQLSFLMCRWSSALAAYNAGTDLDSIRQDLGVSKIQFREIKMKLQRLAKGK